MIEAKGSLYGFPKVFCRQNLCLCRLRQIDEDYCFYKLFIDLNGKNIVLFLI